MASIKHFLKDFLIYSLANWASKILGFILIPLYTRIFTPGDYGMLDLLLTSGLFLTALLDLGLNDALTRFFSAAADEGEQKRYVATVFWVKILLYLPVLTILMAFAGTFSMVLFHQRAQQALVVWALIAVLTSGLWLYFLALYRLRFRALAYSLFSVAYLALTLLLTIYFVVVRRSGVIGVYQAKVLTDVTLLAALLWNNRRFLGKPDFACLRPLLQFGLPLIPAAFVYTALEYLDRYFIQVYWGVTAVGIYSIGRKLATLLTLVTSGFDTVWAPFLYAVHTQPDGAAVIRQIFKGFALLTLLLAFGIGLFARELLAVFTTAAYLAAAPVIPIVVFALVIYATTVRFCVGIGIRKKTHYHLWGGFVATGANFSLNWLLIPRFGISGAAWATLLSHALYGAYVMVISQRLYPVNYGLKRFALLLLIFMGCSWEAARWQELGFWLAAAKVGILLAVGGGLPLLVGFIHVHELVGWHGQAKTYFQRRRQIRRLKISDF